MSWFFGWHAPESKACCREETLAMYGAGPAWSNPFDPQTLEVIHPALPLEITREWAWGGSTGKGVRVAVLDSGIDRSHPAIDGRVSGYFSLSEGPEGPVISNEPHSDAYGHGTACAGIIRTLAPECELYSVQVLGPRLHGQGPVLAAGLSWAIQNGMRVCNLSLGSTKKEYLALLHELVDIAYFQNMVLVTAANNMAIPSYPSSFASVISVASHGTPDPDLYYYNPRPPVEFGAPGIEVRVPWQNGAWINATGNSFAAPHITGIVARILGKHPELTPFELKSILRMLASNAAPPGSPSP